MPVKFPRLPERRWSADYIGLPWVWRGTDPAAGFDCAGWLAYAWRGYWGVSVPDWQADQAEGDDYHREKTARDLIHKFLQDCTEIPRPVPGCGVLMRRGAVPNHVGLYERGGDILHACESAGELVRERAEDIAARIAGYYVPKEAITP